MSCGAASRCWRLSGPRKVWTQDAAGQGRALVVLMGCRTSPETCNLSQQAADSAPGRGGAP